MSYGFFAVYLFTGLFSVLPGSGQVTTVSVSPGTTDATIRAIHGNHLVYLPAAPKKDRLVLMIVGTGGQAKDNAAFNSTVALMGYHVISLDYKNTVITTACSDSKDSSCFNRFREEIVFGTPVSEKVEVNVSNSIYSRFFKLLAYLARTYPDGGWAQYIDGNNIQWKNIIVAGHSQGAGHAAYLGQRFPVSRVLVFSGPQDYLDNFRHPASWLSAKSATPAARVYVFLHVKDPFDFNKQLANCKTLLGQTRTDTVLVQPGAVIRGTSHILVTDISSPNAHGSVLEPRFANAWKYMLENNVTSSRK
jgi:pimeloyl-ACP methyl ester carboxylesterase